MSVRHFECLCGILQQEQHIQSQLVELLLVSGEILLDLVVVTRVSGGVRCCCRVLGTIPTCQPSLHTLSFKNPCFKTIDDQYWYESPLIPGGWVWVWVWVRLWAFSKSNRMCKGIQSREGCEAGSKESRRDSELERE